MLAKVFDPASLDPRIVLAGLDQIHEANDVALESFLQLRVGDAPILVERLVRPREREHVGIDPCAEMLERDAQRPEPPAPGCLLSLACKFAFAKERM